MGNDTLGGATKKDLAMATIIGVFIVVGVTVAAGAWMCSDDCPSFSQVHFDRFVDLIMYIGFGGAIYVGIKATQKAKD